MACEFAFDATTTAGGYGVDGNIFVFAMYGDSTQTHPPAPDGTPETYLEDCNYAASVFNTLVQSGRRKMERRDLGDGHRAVDPR